MSWFRRALAIASALCLLPTAAFADDPYADFRIPEHRTFSWTVSSSANLFTAYSANSFNRDRGRRYDARLASPLAWHAELDSRQYDLFIMPSVSWNRARFQSDQDDALIHQQVSKDRFDYQTLSAFASRNDYLGGGHWFLTYRASGSLALLDDIRSDNGRLVSGTLERLTGNALALRSYSYLGTARVGAGLGRIRDVSGVYGAQLLEQRLLVSGALSRPLSPDTRRRLASLYYIEPDLAAAHDRPDKYFWREVERVLREDGALAGGALDAWSLQRLLEPASRMGTWRRGRGTALSVTIGGSSLRGHLDQDGEQHDLTYSGGLLVSGFASTFSARQRLKQDMVGPGLDFDFERPLGMRWQLEFHAGGTYGVDWTRPVRLQSSAGVTWLVADRWYASGALAQFVFSTRVNGVRAEPGWVAQATGAIGYWVEDAWSLELRLQQDQRMSHYLSTTPEENYTRSGGLSFGLTYRPAGRFTAPGLGISERLTTTPL